MSAIHYLNKAFDLAEQGRGSCAPNPAVGAVLVKDNQIIGAGFHEAYGKTHAEINALSGLTLEQTRGANLYVTLEPCCHHGKTPPCTDAIIQHQIAAVYYAADDVNPLVRQHSIKKLTQAGIDCQQIHLERAENFYASYYYWAREKLPYATYKLAISVDAKSAGENGQPLAITSSALNQITHHSRKRHDAILTTARTIIADDPQLNVRLNHQVEAKTIYVIDRDLTIPLNAKIFQTAKKLIIFHSKNVAREKIIQYEAKQAHCVPIDLKNASELNLKQIWQMLAHDGVHDLWVEAGGKFFAALVREKLLKQAYIVIAPKLLGTSAYATFHDDENLFKDVNAKNWRLQGEEAVLNLKW